MSCAEKGLCLQNLGTILAHSAAHVADMLSPVAKKVIKQFNFRNFIGFPKLENQKVFQDILNNFDCLTTPFLLPCSDSGSD